MAEQILSLNKLAFRIGISREVLEVVANERASHYKPFELNETKRDGSRKIRKIDNPDKAIRRIQRNINKKLLEDLCVNLPLYTTGSIAKRSIIDNATPHIGKEAILLVDIANCFPSIRATAVYGLYRNNLGCSPPVAKLLTKLTTYADRLPQGAPTSPSLCNLILAPLSAELNEVAVKNNLTFTQYVDDITFSGKYSELSLIESEIIAIIESAGFKVSRKKLELIKNRDRMEITGLVVNQTLSVGRKYIRKVQRDIMKLKSENPSIRGKISFIRSTNKSHAKKLTRMLERKLKK